MAYCSLTFNDVLIDQEISGYTTINVEGRGLLNRSVSLVDIPGRDGSHVMDSKLGPRRIKVYYIMKAPDSKTFLERMQQLHDLLSSDSDVKFKFGDESYHRHGRLIEASDPPRDQLEGQGAFVLLCSDPYRYMDEENVSPLSPIPSGFVFDTVPASMTVTLAEVATQIKITNTSTGSNIILDGEYASGDVITLTWGMSPTIKRGSIENILNHLNILSDFEMFTFKSGQSIAVTPVSSSIAMRACKKGR